MEYHRCPATHRSQSLLSVQRLFLSGDYDDGYVAWINGVEVYRSPEMPAGIPDWNTDAMDHESSNGAVPNYGTAVVNYESVIFRPAP